MIELVNRLTGGPMWVHEDRVSEYLEAGHRLAAGQESREKETGDTDCHGPAALAMTEGAGAAAVVAADQSAGTGKKQKKKTGK